MPTDPPPSPFELSPGDQKILPEYLQQLEHLQGWHRPKRYPSPPMKSFTDRLYDNLLFGTTKGMADSDTSENEQHSPDVNTLRQVGNFTQDVLSAVNSDLNNYQGDWSSKNNQHNNPSSSRPYNNQQGNMNEEYPAPYYYPAYSSTIRKDGEYPPYLSDHDKKSNGSIGLGVGVGSAMMLCSLFIFAFWLFKRKRKRGSILPFMGKTGKDANNYEIHHQSPTSSIMDPWELSRTQLIVDYEKKLGSGAFCNVFIGRIVGEAPICQLQPSLRSAQFRDCEVAVKMLPSFADDMARSDFMQEINFMKSLHYHPHLVSMLGWVSDRKSPFLIVEYCAHGDLLHYIRERKELISMGSDNESGIRIKEIVSFAWQIAQGLEYLNSVGCIHRDVAARNVLVADNHICKIGDFGLCRLTDSLLYTARGGRLPLKWMAPESLATFEYSFKSDVWSYGILLWELFSLGEVPFGAIQTVDLLQYIKQNGRPERPDFCTDEVWSILESCWQFTAASRPSFTELSQKFAQILEIATESYGYLIPISRLRGSQISNV